MYKRQKLGDVNFAGDTATTGPRRTLLVTSLDNDEVVAGDAVSLGDTNITPTDDDGIFSGDTGGAITIGTNGGTAFNTSGIRSLTTDDDAIVANVAMASGFTGSESFNMVDATAVLNSFVTVTSSHAQSAAFVITGTDLKGDALTETITAHASGSYPETKVTTNIFATVTSCLLYTSPSPRD